MIADLEGGGGTLRRVRPHAATGAGTDTSHGLTVPEKGTGCKVLTDGHHLQLELGLDAAVIGDWDFPEGIRFRKREVITQHELVVDKLASGLDLNVSAFVCRRCELQAFMSFGSPVPKDGTPAFECREHKADGVTVYSMSLTWSKPRSRFIAPCYSAAELGEA